MQSSMLALDFLVRHELHARGTRLRLAGGDLMGSDTSPDRGCCIRAGEDILLYPGSWIAEQRNT
jgi:hypothetical protein